MIVALGGYSRTGKDEVGKILMNVGFMRVAKGDLIKQAALEIDPPTYTDATLAEVVTEEGWDAAKDKYAEIRRFLQNLPDAVVKACGRDVWNDAIFRVINERGLTDVVLTRVCLEEEARMVKHHGGVVWNVVRPGVGPVNDSANEHGLDDWPFDTTIINDGSLADLSNTVLSALTRATLDA